MDKRMSAIALAVIGGLCVYAGVTGYHLDDALRVVLGKKPTKPLRGGLGRRMTGSQDMPKGVPITLGAKTPGGAPADPDNGPIQT